MAGGDIVPNWSRRCPRGLVAALVALAWAATGMRGMVQRMEIGSLVGLGWGGVAWVRESESVWGSVVAVFVVVVVVVVVVVEDVMMRRCGGEACTVLR